MSSAEQDQWVEIGNAIRAHLAHLAKDMPLMKVDELKNYIDACNQAEFTDRQMQAHDDAVESLRATLQREAQYGS